MTTPYSNPQPSSVQAIPREPFLIFDSADLVHHFNIRASSVRHRLIGHPLFELPRLLELARFLPEQHVRVHSGKVPINATPDQMPVPGESIEESFQSIAGSNAWIMLKRIEQKPEYRDLLHSCLSEIEAMAHPVLRGIWAREGYIFISSANQVTPYHMDPEINFLLQIRGRKVICILPGEDRQILSEQEIEQFYTGNHKALIFKDEVRHRAAVFDMEPGDGVHIPVNHPHWVTNGDAIAISFALTLQSDWTRRRGSIYAVNHHLRRLGLRPTPFGRSQVRDFFKDHGFRCWTRCKALLPGKKRQQIPH